LYVKDILDTWERGDSQVEEKAKYQIASMMNEGILEFVITGELPKGDVEEMQIKIAGIISESGTRNVLVDCRAVGEPRIGIMENYFAVRSTPVQGLRVNVAVVDLPKHREMGEFLETTAFNVGLSHKFFTELDAARAWLKSK
jgi:hypothetical protein